MPDREKAIRILEGNYKNFVLRHNGELLTVNELIALLKAQEPRVMADTELEAIRKAPLILKPAVDAVPVVFCKDCKYSHMTYDGEVKYCDRISMPDDEGDYGYALYLPGDWFCADGERRESE